MPRLPGDRLDTQRSQLCGACPKVSSLEIQNSQCFHLSLKAGKGQCSRLKAGGGGGGREFSFLGEGQIICSSQAFNQLDEAHVHSALRALLT